jgi:hypothetical protein
MGHVTSVGRKPALNKIGTPFDADLCRFQSASNPEGVNKLDARPLRSHKAEIDKMIISEINYALSAIPAITPYTVMSARER